jgi:hypothetical protein
VRTAKEVRELIEAVSGGPSDPFGVEKGSIGLRGSRHIQGALEPGSLTCYKQHRVLRNWLDAASAGHGLGKRARHPARF